MYRLVIDEQSIYEVDEECLKKKERNEKRGEATMLHAGNQELLQ